MNITELKAKRREASNKAKMVKCSVQHEVLRREVISLTRQIKALEA
jgi:hypothetical protein